MIISLRTLVRSISIVVMTLPSVVGGNSPLNHLNFKRPISPHEKKDTLVHANEVSYEEELGLVIARGNVRISDGQDVLEASTVTYNKKLNTLSASGNVRLYKATGELITGNYLELSEDMKKGFVDKIYMITPSEEKFAAQKGYKEGEIVTMEHAVYSPCQFCKVDKTKALTWQMRASTIIRDEESQDISYRNLILDFKGVPSFYLPYFRHPDPTVERRSGVLMPTFSSGGDLGSTVILPLYWSISPHQDITLLPTYMSKEGSLLEAVYRGAFSKGTLNIDTSTTRTKAVNSSSTAPQVNPTKRQAHIAANARIDLTDTWRFKADGTYVSDPTYFRRYYFVQNGKFYASGTLENQAFLEGFYDRNYVAMGAYDFQNLRANIDPHTIPSVLPVTEGNYHFDADTLGGNWQFGWNQNYVTRRLGTKMGRVSSWGSYNLPYISSLGTSHLVQAETRGDVYKIDHYNVLSATSPVNQTRGRVIPTLSLHNSMPFINYIREHSVVLEPVLKGVLSTNASNDKKIPVEDSQDFEFDTTNLMRTNRLPGFDLVDAGQRLSYGVNFNFYEKGVTQRVKGFVGQSYSFSKENQFNPYSGIYKGRSDYVSSLMLTPHSYFTLNFMARFDRDSLRANKNLVQATMGPRLLNINIDYISVHRQFVDNQYVPRKQLTTGLNSQFHENWSTYVKVTKELGYRPGDLEHGAGLRYSDDCFSLNLDAFRTFFQDRDLKPSKTIMLTFGFKNLGTYSTGRLDLNTLGESIPENPNAPKTPSAP